MLAGTSDYDGPLLGDGRSVFKATYRIAIHPKAPFGVVSMQVEAEGREIGDEDEPTVSVMATKTLTLAETGTNAVGDLPKASAKKPKQ